MNSVHAETVSDFDTLFNKLNSGTGTVSLELDSDIIGSKGFVSNNSLSKFTINGNGKNIDWANSNGFFSPSQKTNIVLNNFGVINIVDGIAVDGEGGLQNANAVGHPFLHIHNGDVSLNQVVINANRSLHFGGGGLQYTGNGTVRIDQSIFENNQGGSGGALALLQEGLRPQTHKISNSSFKNNQGDYGGAIFLGPVQEIIWGSGQSPIYKPSNVEISSTNFTGNHASEEGGALYMESLDKSGFSSSVIKDCSFIGNSAIKNGGAIALINSGATIGSPKLRLIAETRNVIFSGNSAQGHGDAIYLKTSHLALGVNSGRKIVFYDDIYAAPNTTSYISINGPFSMGTGEVQFHKPVENASINMYGGTLSLLGEGTDLSTSTLFLQLNESTINTVDNHINQIRIQTFESTGSWLKHKLRVDVDLKEAKVDHFKISKVNFVDGQLSVSHWNIIGEDTPLSEVYVTLTDTEGLPDAEKEALNNLFTLEDSAKTALYRGPIYTKVWDVSHVEGATYLFSNPEITSQPWTPLEPSQPIEPNEPWIPLEPSQPVPSRPDIFNPDVYAPTLAMATIAHLQHEIASNLFRDYSNQMSWGRLYEDKTPSRKPLWVMGFGGNFDWNTKNYSSLDVQYETLMTGYKFDPHPLGGGQYEWGLYLGGINDEIEYKGDNSIRQHGGFVGAQFLYTQETFWAGLHSNVGLMHNDFKSPSMDSSDNAPWISVGGILGYSYIIPKYEMIISPMLTANYVWVDDMHTHGLGHTCYHLDASDSWEISPEIRVTKEFKNHIQTYLSARYAFGNQETTQGFAANVALPNIELKNYAQYGFGFEKQGQKQAFKAFVQYNDDGRTGWTGSIRYDWRFK